MQTIFTNYRRKGKEEREKNGGKESNSVGVKARIPLLSTAPFA